MKALEILKSPIVEIGSDSDLNLHSKAVVLFATREQIQEAISELEALRTKSCNGCRHGKFGADSRGIEAECTLIWHCVRGNGFPDRYEPKGTK